MSKLKYFLKGLFIAALLLLSFYFGRRASLRKALKARKDLLHERLKRVDERIEEMQEVKNSYAYIALDDSEKGRLDEAYRSEKKKRERTINKINKNPDPDKNEEILAALKDIFAN